MGLSKFIEIVQRSERSKLTLFIIWTPRPPPSSEYEKDQVSAQRQRFKARRLIVIRAGKRGDAKGDEMCRVRITKLLFLHQAEKRNTTKTRYLETCFKQDAKKVEQRERKVA